MKKIFILLLAMLLSVCASFAIACDKPDNSTPDNDTQQEEVVGGEEQAEAAVYKLYSIKNEYSIPGFTSLEFGLGDTYLDGIVLTEDYFTIYLYEDGKAVKKTLEDEMETTWTQDGYTVVINDLSGINPDDYSVTSFHFEEDGAKLVFVASAYIVEGDLSYSIVQTTVLVRK